MLAGQSRMAGDEANGAAILENAANNIDGLETVVESTPAPVTVTDTDTDSWGSDDDDDWN